jgi:Family of unknown function (DUF5947)
MTGAFMSTGASTGALERVIRRAGTRRRDTREHCELCREPVPEEHRHLLDVDSGEVLCACRACSILFDREAAGNGRYRLLPDRRLRLSGIDPAVLGVPVGLAFFVVQPGGEVLAHYPSPAGATRWEIDPEAWRAVVRDCPVLADLAPRMEALLVNTTGDRREEWLVPVDDCYRLVAVVRREWTGLTGGDRVGPEIEGFFDELGRRYGQHPGR